MENKVYTIGDIEESLIKLDNICDEKGLDIDEVISQNARLEELNGDFNEMMAGGAIPESAFDEVICSEMCEEIEKLINSLNK